MPEERLFFFSLLFYSITKNLLSHIALREVNPAYETARELKGLLQHYHILNDEEPHLGENKYQFYVSDGAEKFKHFANSIIKYGILSAKTIKIDEY